MDIDRQYLLWEFDGKKRIEYLLGQKEADPKGEVDYNTFIELVSYRFAYDEKRSFDRFIKFWLMLVYYSERLESKRGLSEARKEILGFIGDKRLNGILEASTRGEGILYEELLNSVLLYFHTCYNDSNFKSYAFGLVKMDNNALLAKIAGQANAMAVTVPEKTGLVKELALSTRAVLEGMEVFRRPAAGGYRY